MSELLPCPFCGGDATLDADHGDNMFRVFCEDCDAGSTWFEDQSSTIAAWNRRAPPSDLQSREGT